MSRLPSVFYCHRTSEQGIFLNAIGDALDNLVHNGAVIALRFVITKAHHPPMFANSIPMYFNDAVVDLFTAGL
jgi:hypothetical protein